MLSVNVGPLAFPLPPLLVLGGVLLAVAVARGVTSQHLRTLARRAGTRVAPAERRAATWQAEWSIWRAVLAGLVAARAAHVGLHATAYATTPLSILDVRDGGWMAWPGVLAGAAVLAWCALRGPAPRTAVFGGGAAGLAAWGLAGLLLLPGDTARPLEAASRVPLTALEAAPGSAPQALAALQDGRPLVVNLWATWCPPCREEMPVFAEAEQRHPGVRFLMVNQGEGVAVVQRYLARERLVLKDVWLDPASALGPAVGSRGLPTTLFLDPQGRQVAAHTGAINAAALGAQIKRLQAASR